MSRLKDYINIIENFYNNEPTDEESSKRVIHPSFDEANEENQQTAYLINSFYFQRYGRLPNNVAEWGCGIGRLFQAFRNLNIQVDGFDISKIMLKIAKDKYPESNVYQVYSDGSLVNKNEVVYTTYDIVYSFLVLQHNCNRYLRLKNLENVSNLLNDTGMVVIQMLYSEYPIKEPHKKYSDNSTSKLTNSGSDCIIDKETLGQVYEDFSMFFYDIGFQFIEIKSVLKQRREHQIVIHGTKNKILGERIYGSTPSYDFSKD